MYRHAVTWKNHNPPPAICKMSMKINQFPTCSNKELLLSRNFRSPRCEQKTQPPRHFITSAISKENSMFRSACGPGLCANYPRCRWWKILWCGPRVKKQAFSLEFWGGKQKLLILTHFECFPVPKPPLTLWRPYRDLNENPRSPNCRWFGTGCSKFWVAM